jgi:hypothetical protein
MLHWQQLAQRSLSLGGSTEAPQEQGRLVDHGTAGGVYFDRPAAAHAFVDELVSDDIVSASKVRRDTFSGFMAMFREDCVAWSHERDRDGSMMDPATGHIDLDRGDNDPITPVTDAFVRNTWLLHLTDWNVASVVEAMMVRRVLESYFDFGGFMVLDGNVPLLQYDAGSKVFENKYTATRNMLKERILIM